MIIIAIIKEKKDDFDEGIEEVEIELLRQKIMK